MDDSTNVITNPKNSSDTSQFSAQNITIGTANVHQYQANTMIIVRPPPEEHLPEIWNVPGRNNHFTGRTELLVNISAILNYQTTTHLVLTTHGLGGAGKTQSALEFVWRNYKNYKGTCWFKASNRNLLISDYISLGHLLRIFSEAQKSASQEEKAKLVKAWLESPSRSNWLLVFDNVLNHDDIHDLLPVKEGKILITSRHATWPTYQAIEVKVFSPEEAIIYIRKIVGDIKFDQKQSELLIEKLGRLPLALAQACDYIKRNPFVTIEKYLDLYQKKYTLLLADNLLPRSQYENSVMTAWNITLDYFKEISPASVRLLNCCSFLYHDKIPVELSSYFLDISDADELEITANTAKRIAKEYSMIDINEEQQMISIHQVIQDVVRGSLKNEFLKYLIITVKGLLKACPFDRHHADDIAVKKKLLIHFETVLKILESTSRLLDQKQNEYQINWKKELLLPVLEYLAEMYFDCRNIKVAKFYFKRTLRLKEQEFGQDHIEVGITLKSLGVMNLYLGNPKKAERHLKRALPIYEKSPGEKGTDVSTILTNLGIATSDCGNLSEARVLFERSLKIKEELLGKDHWRVAASLVNLADVLWELGETAQAHKLFNRTLEIQEPHFGEDNPQLEATVANIGTTALELGDIKTAREYLERARSINEKEYGKNHWQTALAVCSLSEVFLSSGETNTAKEKLDHALTILRNHYGEGHWEVALREKKLADTYLLLNNPEEAKRLLEQVLPIIEKQFGNHFWRFAVTLRSLAESNKNLNRLEEAKAQYEQTLSIQKTLYGESHWQIALTLKGYAETLIKLGHTELAMSLLNNALAIQEEFYGKDHWQVKITQKIIAKLKDITDTNLTSVSCIQSPLNPSFANHPCSMFSKPAGSKPAPIEGDSYVINTNPHLSRNNN